MMPEMDGIEAAQKLRGMGYNGVIVALTANATVGNDKMFKENGFDGFVSKPIDVQQLDDTLKEFISRRHPGEAEKYKAEATAAVQPQSPETDRKLLQIFCRDALAAAESLRETLANGNIKLFTTTVHAMKSALANVGKHAASKLAFALEDAGHDEDVELISANIEGFVKTLLSIVEKFTPKEPAVDTADITEDRTYLSEQLQIVVKACADYDETAAYAALDKLKEKQWKPETAAAIEEIRDAIFLNSDFDGAANLAARVADDVS